MPDCFKIQVFEAIVRAILAYGLEGVQLNDSVINKINTVQLKGLRQILKMKTTYVNGDNTNQKVFEEANKRIQQEHGQTSNTPRHNTLPKDITLNIKQESS